MARPGLGLRLKLTHAQRDVLVDDASGDSLDAVLCLVQAAWAYARHAQGDARYGLPADLDPLEGWIVTAGNGGQASSGLLDDGLFQFEGQLGNRQSGRAARC